MFCAIFNFQTRSSLRQDLETLDATLEDRIDKAVEEADAKATVPMLETIAEKDKEILRLKSQIGKIPPTFPKPLATIA